MIPRRCPKCQTLVDEAEASIPSTSPLWAVPCSPETTEHVTGLNSSNGIGVKAREPGPDSGQPGSRQPDSRREGVVPAS